MKIAIIGGGISGLSAAFYLKKFSLPVSQVLVLESSSRFGGWIRSKKISLDSDGQSNESNVIFEKGPRTLRASTGELKELNSLKLAMDLDMNTDHVDIVSKKHPAALNRYIYLNNQVTPLKFSMFRKTELMPKPMLSYAWKEFRMPPRDPSITDESIASFVSRRFSSEIVENLVDPLFKGICGGDVHRLSAAMLMKKFYDYESNYGSILKGALNRNNKLKENQELANYPDLAYIKKDFSNYSVWRMRNGMEDLVDRLVKRLEQDKDMIQLNLNESVQSLEYDTSKKHGKIKIKTNKSEHQVDLVVSSVYSKYLANMLPENENKLKRALNKIQSVNMVVMNLYFKQDVLDIQGFGYLVPTNQKSALLGCIFDSVFKRSNESYTNLTVMMGGAWYDEIIGSKTDKEIYNLAYQELRNHLRLQVEPDYYEIDRLLNAIPQYHVGHNDLVSHIHECLAESNLNERLYLIGNSYEGVGVNDAIFNARKLVENKLKQKNSELNLNVTE